MKTRKLLQQLKQYCEAAIAQQKKEEEQTLRNQINALHDRGFTAKQICNFLNIMDIATPLGNHIELTTVHRYMLKSKKK